jgi:LPS export ABC transporter protein LptC
MRHVRIIMLALGLLGLMPGCEKAPASRAPSAEEQASLVFSGFTAQGTKDGVKEWEAEAVTAQVFNQKKMARAQNMKIRYFQKGQLASVAQAREAEIGTESNDLLAWGNVVLRANNGVVLYADRLRWENKRGRLSSDGPVKVVRQGSVLTGRGLVADRNLEDVVVREDVQITTAPVSEVRKQQWQLDQMKPTGAGK